MAKVNWSEFVKAGAEGCPYCGSEKTQPEPEEARMGCITVLAWCEECEKEWVTEFEVVRAGPA
jgi:biotin synthase-like enzyme